MDAWHYEERAPAPALTPWVDRYWSLSGSGDDEPLEIVPDGCMEIVVHYGARFRRLRDDGVSELQSRTLVAGQISRRIRLSPLGEAGVLGIRLRPEAAAALLGTAPAELREAWAPLDALWPDVATEIEERVGEAHDMDGRVRAAETVLTRRIRHATRPDIAVREAVAAIRGTSGMASVSALAEHVRLSRRQLERRFQREVGVAPKLLSRIVRFASLFEQLERGGSPRWAELAAAGGYSDQAHLVKEFAAFAGRSPAAFVRESGEVTWKFAAPGEG